MINLYSILGSVIYSNGHISGEQVYTEFIVAESEDEAKGKFESMILNKFPLSDICSMIETEVRECKLITKGV